MRIFTQHVVLLVALLLAVTGAQAQTFELDGISYEVTSGNEVSVTNATGNVQILAIPEKVSNEGVEYTVTGIGEAAFSGSRRLALIVIPASVTSIGDLAFSNCPMLKSFEIPASVTSIGDQAFGNCRGLTRVVLPKGLNTLSTTAFSGCSSLLEVVWLTESESCLDAFQGMMDNLNADGTVTVYSSNEILDKLPEMDHVQHRSMWYGIRQFEYKFTRTTFSFFSDIPFVTVENIYWGEELLSPTDGVYSLDGLTPGNTYTITADISIDGISYPTQYTLQTAYLDVEQTEKGATTAEVHGITGFYSRFDIIERGFEGYEAEDSVLRLAGLDPETEYTVRYYVVTTEEGTFTKDFTFRTDVLEFGLPSAQVTSNAVALRAGTNLSERETSAGFEWRRADAPDQEPSTPSSCQAVDGVLTDTLRNLSANTSYKFRPYYISASGKTYYGEWATFTTEDGMGIASIGSDAEGLEVAVRGNLAQGSAALRVTGDGGEAFWALTTLSGSVSAQGAVAADGTWQALEASGLPRGIYLLTVRNGQSAKTVKVTVL